MTSSGELGSWNAGKVRIGGINPWKKRARKEILPGERP